MILCKVVDEIRIVPEVSSRSGDETKRQRKSLETPNFTT